MVATLCWGAIVFLAPVAEWRDKTPRGPLTNAEDWPLAIHSLRSAVEGAGVAPEEFDVFLLYGHPRSPDNTVICRLPDSESAFAALQSRLGLQPGATDYTTSAFFEDSVKLAPSDWWVRPDSRPEIYGNHSFLVGQQGRWFVVVRDHEQQRMFIHVHYRYDS